MTALHDLVGIGLEYKVEVMDSGGTILISDWFSYGSLEWTILFDVHSEGWYVGSRYVYSENYFYDLEMEKERMEREMRPTVVVT